jgi:beta-lactamase superfamily II metal-dependent hydrolase
MKEGVASKIKAVCIICVVMLVASFALIIDWSEEDELDRLLSEKAAAESELFDLYVDLAGIYDELRDLDDFDIEDIEEDIIALNKHIEALEKAIQALEDRIAELERRIAELRERQKEDDDDPKVIEDLGDLSIHFLELGNKYTGDSVYINYNGYDILIDAGSRTSSSTTIINYLKNYVTDDTLDFVIATHAHQDHIAGFYSSGSGVNRTTGVLDAFNIGTIIDYPMTNSTTVTRKNYEETRDRLVRNGTEHYTALECYRGINGAERIYDLGDGVTLEILYNYYYENKTSNENNYSVCVMIVMENENGRQQYLFTGDLEKAGEDRLVDYYKTEYGGLGECVLYKGGHHGSATSSNESLLDAIRPTYVIICTCAGTSEYSKTVSNQFPTQEFINRIARYTDEVYVTTLINDYAGNKFGPMNGNIIFTVTDGDISIICSSDDRKLKDTEWFLKYRTMPDEWKDQG